MKRRRYSNRQKREYLEEYRKSGKTPAEFSKRKNIVLSTFCNWLRESKSEIEPQSDIELEVNEDFGEVKIEDINPSLMLVTDKIKIELQEGYNKQFLHKLMEVIL